MARPKAQAVAETSDQSPKTAAKRFYPGQQELDSDLFKLEVESMLKNISWNSKRPDYIKVEHCHFMRTVDSAGKKLDACSLVGGHFHYVTVTEHEDGALTAECSEAMEWGFESVNGQTKRVGIPIKHDQHKHDVTYVKSIKIKPRVYNEKFAEIQSKLLAKIPGGVDGVTG